MLWWWTVEYAHDGDLSGFDAEEIAIACMWEGAADDFLEALRSAGFVEENGAVHDWHEYAGKLIERRRQDAERKQIARQNARLQDVRDVTSITSTVVQRTSAGHPPDGVRTVPNRTVPHLTQPSSSPPPPPSTPDDAPDADAPDAPASRPGGALAGRSPMTPVPKPEKNGTHPFSDLWEAFDAVLGTVSAPTEKNRRAKACQELRKGHYTSEQIPRAAGAWANVMGDATMTELGLAANMGRLLRGPQRNGRFAGTVTQHTQKVTEYAAMNRGPKRGAAAIEDDGWRLSEHAG